MRQSPSMLNGFENGVPMHQGLRLMNAAAMTPSALITAARTVAVEMSMVMGASWVQGIKATWIENYGSQTQPTEKVCRHDSGRLRQSFRVQHTQP